LPVQLGVDVAARLACVVMAVPQIIVVALLLSWSRPVHAAVVAAFVLVQLGLMTRLVRDPKGRAAWYNATGTTLYVLGMLVSAFAVRTLF
ncbi:MAG: bacteriochlorophyll/chlorophyll a synthase, partial [Myxococcota bacterium]